MNIVDRILTVVITATLTSAAWIVFGGSLMENASDRDPERSVRPAEAAPSPTGSATDAGGEDATGEDGEAGESSAVQDLEAGSPLDTQTAVVPEDPGERTLMIPVKNVRATELTDTFLDDRGGGERLHEAIDIMAPTGTSIVAAAPGTVEKLFYSEAGGKTIYVRSGDRRTIHYYAHLDAYADGLNEGQKIRRGQRLGTVGSSGNASADAPHLHFAILRTTADAEWWEPANAVNPYPLLKKR